MTSLGGRVSLGPPEGATGLAHCWLSNITASTTTPFKKDRDLFTGFLFFRSPIPPQN